MPFQYIDPALPKAIEGWRSPALGLEMPIVRYGTRGHPVLLYPTAAADFLENERFFLVKAVEPLIFAGQIQLFSIDSINRHAWMDRDLPVREQARRQALYSRYVEEEVVPHIRRRIGADWARIITTGASFGCFHAANQFFRRPDLFDGLVGMSGFYDLDPSYLKGFMNEDAYFNNPMSFVRNMGGEALHRLRTVTKIVLCTGQGAFEAPEASRRMSRLLDEKGIPHWLDVWGTDVRHDWPWWRKMLPYFLEKIL